VRPGEGCGGQGAPELSELLGYSAEELRSLPEGSNLGLGCGNPVSAANLKDGEEVLDLGSGKGIDCFLASRLVGSSGRVVGVDMTAAMLTAARANASKHAVKNVEFRLGEIEALPVADNSFDVVISNCVVNLSPEKDRVIREIARALKPGGRICLSDVLARSEAPVCIPGDDTTNICACITGAKSQNYMEGALRAAGLVDIAFELNEDSGKFISKWVPDSGAESQVISAIVRARKPLEAGGGNETAPFCCGEPAAAAPPPSQGGGCGGGKGCC
jgi:SAM-dependent methyltransferase